MRILELKVGLILYGVTVAWSLVVGFSLIMNLQSNASFIPILLRERNFVKSALENLRSIVMEWDKILEKLRIQDRRRDDLALFQEELTRFFKYTFNMRTEVDNLTVTVIPGFYDKFHVEFDIRNTI